MADPVISVKLIVLYRFLSHNFPRSKTMWFLANSSIWHTKMLLNLTIPHPTTSLNVFLSQFPSFSSCLEQRTVRNTRGPFLVLFSFMKEQVFVPKTPNIFAIMTGPPSTIVHKWSFMALVCISLIIQRCSTVQRTIWPPNHRSHTKVYFNEVVANALGDDIGIVIFDLRGHGGC